MASAASDAKWAASADVGSVTRTNKPTPKVVEVNLEVIVIAVGDVDRAKRFYESLGWRLDADVDGGQDFRLVQFTPPGSGCSVQFGINLISAAPGSGQILYLVVSDIEVARDDLMARGVEVSEVFHEGQPGARFHDIGRVTGLSPDRGSYGSFASFMDPDGNGWLIQEVTTRIPGRIDPGATSYASASDLAEALRRAEQAHGVHEKRVGAADPDWPDWYAKYMVAELAGTELAT
jgi:catechol 2,3-dioxygenase-like lactoylglutathione lyase family enzyme